jgi:MFS family permease
MSPYVSWSLVALCFALGVAGGSVSNSFAVFVPPLQSSFDASRGAITVIYSFTFLASGAVGPIAGLLVDRLGLRALALIGISATALALEGASFASEVARSGPGPRQRLARGRVELVIAWPLVFGTTPRCRHRGGLVCLRRRRHDRPPARPAALKLSLCVQTPRDAGGLT